jgi:hypothetical protein
LVEFHADDSSNIFTKHPTGPGKFDDAKHFRPEVAVICFALSLPGAAVWLAWPPSSDNVDCSIFDWVESLHVFVDRHAGEVLGQDFPRPWVYLAEGYGFDSAHPLSRKREATDAREQIQMSNKAWEATPGSMVGEFVRHWRRAST